MAGAILGHVALGLGSAVVASHDLDRSNRETREAELLARRAAESLRGLEPTEMIALAAAKAAGSSTLLDTLASASETSLDGARIEVDLPVSATTGTVEEDLVVLDLGLPMDLNLDGAVDGNDRSTDCRVLPIRVRVEWRGRDGTRRFELVQVLLATSLRENLDANL